MSFTKWGYNLIILIKYSAFQLISLNITGNIPNIKLYAIYIFWHSIKMKPLNRVMCIQEK